MCLYPSLAHSAGVNLWTIFLLDCPFFVDLEELCLLQLLKSVLHVPDISPRVLPFYFMSSITCQKTVLCSVSLSLFFVVALRDVSRGGGVYKSRASSL